MTTNMIRTAHMRSLLSPDEVAALQPGDRVALGVAGATHGEVVRVTQAQVIVAAYAYDADGERRLSRQERYWRTGRLAGHAVGSIGRLLEPDEHVEAAHRARAVNKVRTHHLAYVTHAEWRRMPEDVIAAVYEAIAPHLKEMRTLPPVSGA